MTRVKIADCFELKQEANFSETYLTEECLQKKTLKSFAPVVGLLKSSHVQLIAGVKE